MDDAWGLELNTVKGRSSDFSRKWEGEDEEDYVMDSWDQEPEDVEGDVSRTSGLDRSDDTQTDNESHRENWKSSLTSEAELSPRRSEETLEKLYLKRLQEEEDLKLAKDVFGVQTVLDSEESYDKFKVKLKGVIEDAIKNIHYTSFTEDVVQTLCNHLSSNELKKIVIRLSNLQIQKNSTKKVEKKKPKGKLKVKLRVEDDIHDYNEYSAYLEDDGYI